MTQFVLIYEGLFAMEVDQTGLLGTKSKKQPIA